MIFHSEDVIRAQYFAIGAHGQQKRKYTGEPYWYHMSNVVKILEQNGHSDTRILQAAWLHDVVEDTSFSIFDITAVFADKRLTLWVDFLTEPSKEFGNRAKRKAFYKDQLEASPPEVQTIKLADLIDNTKSIVKLDPDFAKTYLIEKRDLLMVLKKGCPKLYDIARHQLKTNGVSL